MKISSNTKFGKSEKLKQRSQIKELFSQGKTIKQFPVKLVYLPQDACKAHKVGVSVPKRNFKRAVDRNQLKRILREAYRLNKDLLSNTPQPYTMMLIYSGKEKRDFQQISSCIQKLMRKLTDRES